MRDTPRYQRSVGPDGNDAAVVREFHRELLTIYPYSVKLQDTNVGVCSTLEEASRRAQQFADANPGRVVTIIDRSNGDTRVVDPKF